MWVRGLKLVNASLNLGSLLSHPMWVRGLKPAIQPYLYSPVSVAPHVGAWIETNIENHSPNLSMSHPMWVRGLKLIFRLNLIKVLMVAPHVGAWIETGKVIITL